MFGFGFGATGKQGKGKAGTKKASRKDATKSKDTKDKADKAEKSAPTTSAETKLQKAKDMNELLDRMNPLALWNGTLKEKDVEQKLKKAMDICEALQKDASSDANAMTMLDSVEEKSMNLSQILDHFSSIRHTFESFTTGNAGKIEFSDDLMRFLSTKLREDVVIAIVTQAGRILTEAGAAATVSHISFHMSHV